MKDKFAFFIKSPHIIVVGLWLFFQCLWYSRFGFVFTLEAPKYINQAHYVLEHHSFSQFRFLFYFTTIAVIAFSLSIKTGAVGALLIIMAINLAAYLSFFSALWKFFGRKAPALIVVVLLLSFWPYQSWSLFLFTECMFYSLVLFLFGHLLRFTVLNFRFVSNACLLLLLLIISRPLGILFVPPVLFFIAVHLTKRQRVYLFFAGTAFCVLLNSIVHIFFTTTSDWSMNYALTGDMIICDMPLNDGSYQANLSNDPNQLYQLFYYLQHNFSHFIGLAAVRLKYFFTMLRPYNSFAHNLYLIVYDVIFYGSLVINARRLFRIVPKAILLFIFSTILFFALVIATQCDEYHSRFFLTLTPFFVTLTVIGWQPVAMRFFNSYSRNRRAPE